jgi:hypothetical protein
MSRFVPALLPPSYDPLQFFALACVVMAAHDDFADFFFFLGFFSSLYPLCPSSDAWI